MLGLGTPESHGLSARSRFGSPGAAADELAKLKAYWHDTLRGIKVKTSAADFDSMVNTWGAYNSLVTYTWSRHASLIYNGERDGLGFRDTVQDFLGAMPYLKDQIRPRLELMLSGQFSSGGAMPVVKPFDHHPGMMPEIGPEEYRSDDCLWFFNAIPEYVAETGNIDFYNKVIPYADCGEDTVFGHLKAAILFNLKRSGANGLPCGLKADWNDCVRMGYKGESVMVAFQLSYALGIYADIAKWLVKPEEADWSLKERKRLDADIQKAAWDGKWYLWAIGEDGHRYGSEKEDEGKIYMNSQVWSVISGSVSPEQGRSAMKYLDKLCATPFGIMLSAPPFTYTPRTVMGGVIYNHGIKENAGIFCHTQGWAVMAEAILGNGDQAWSYYNAYMPSAYNDRAEIRECEPYVHCQTTYATCNRNAGKSRVPWLTGTASWSHHSALQYILGIRPEIEGLRIDPCIPKSWDGFEAERDFRGSTVRIRVKNPNGLCKGIFHLTVDGKTIEGNLLPLHLLHDGVEVEAVISRGASPPEKYPTLRKHQALSLDAEDGAGDQKDYTPVYK
jgi:cellobiose phosphorylase